MSKITFRADDDLVTRLEARQESKSEIMREALRMYLEDEGTSRESSEVADVIVDRVDEVLVDRLDAALDDRIDAALDERLGVAPDGFAGQSANTRDSGRDIHVNVSLDGVSGDGEATTATVSKPAEGSENGAAEPRDDGADATASCDGCGETMPSDHVYCPNCGEKRSHRVFCECGDELRSDWSFCPGCGRRTPAADVLDTR